MKRKQKTNNWAIASLVGSQGKARKTTRNIQEKHQETIRKYVRNPQPHLLCIEGGS
jgi:hypothetical protein